jgi:EpsI family protein
MPEKQLKTKVLGSTPARFAALLLGLEAAFFYLVPTAERVPELKPLSSFTQQFGGWQSIREAEIDPEIVDALKADDTLSRLYGGPASSMPVSLFIASYGSQRAGVSPHSPKVCLPGSGWIDLRSAEIPVDVPGESSPIRINRYVVAKGEDQSLVLYWYQTAHRVIANEYWAKLYLIWDGLLYRRSDASVVRVIVPITETQKENAAQETGLQFIRALYPSLKAHLPGA